MRKRYSDEEIKNEIVRVKQLIGRIPTQENYKKHGSISLNTILLRKNWNIWLDEIFNNIVQINTQDKENKISDEDLLTNLKELQEKLGRAPKQTELKLGKYSLYTYLRAFGNFSKALEKIGAISSKRYFVEDNEILDDIKRIYNDLGKVPTIEDFRKLNHCSNSFTVINRFGSWKKALEEAGVPTN
jgi:hypothetical protein